jgi:hypothetical protein
VLSFYAFFRIGSVWKTDEEIKTRLIPDARRFNFTLMFRSYNFWRGLVELMEKCKVVKELEIPKTADRLYRDFPRKVRGEQF